MKTLFILEDNYFRFDSRYKEEYSRFLHQPSTQDMLNKYKNVMNYLTQHSGKVVNTTSEVTYLYNLFKEQVIPLLCCGNTEYVSYKSLIIKWHLF